ncbi:MAG: hypothetical protein ACYSW3_02210 [Planctomycetota bacterium]|jgi:hypothetical protein
MTNSSTGGGSFEFYIIPIDLRNQAELRVQPKFDVDHLATLTDKQRIELTIQKWKTLEDLLVADAHNYHSVMEDYEWSIANGGMSTCALCVHHMLGTESPRGCESCPVGMAYGRACQNTPYEEYNTSEDIHQAIIAAQSCQDFLRRLPEYVR